MEACRLLVGGASLSWSGKETKRISGPVKGSGGPQFGAQGMSARHMPSTRPASREERGSREEGGCRLSSLVAGSDISGRGGAG